MLQTGSTKLFQLDETLSAHQILRASSNVLCCMMWRENASWWRATVKEYLVDGWDVKERVHYIWRVPFEYLVDDWDVKERVHHIWRVPFEYLVDGWDVKERVLHIWRVSFEYLVDGWLSCMRRKDWHQRPLWVPWWEERLHHQ
jgi:hypothetical protein